MIIRNTLLVFVFVLAIDYAAMYNCSTLDDYYIMVIVRVFYLPIIAILVWVASWLNKQTWMKQFGQKWPNVAATISVTAVLLIAWMIMEHIWRGFC